MWKKLKNGLKRIIPPPTSTFQREIKSINAKSDKQYQAFSNDTDLRFASLQHGIDENSKCLQRLEAEVEKVEKLVSGMTDTIGSTSRSAATIQRRSQELLWANAFRAYIEKSNWIVDTAFTPGRWAVGYPYLYVLFRVLNEMAPKRILDIGLGQTSKLIAQYAASHDDVEHIIVEHDVEWVDFFYNQLQMSDNSRIEIMTCEMIPFREAEAVRVYKEFDERFCGKQFDLISIDAPYGFDMNKYSRIDTLRLMPACLADEFVILLDDFDRPAEKNTFLAMESVLKESGISYEKGKYYGENDLMLLCSSNRKFLTSL